MNYALSCPQLNETLFSGYPRMINHFVAFQSALHSFNNSALFIGGRKATKQQLVPMIARSEVQLCQNIVDGVKRGLHGYVERQCEELERLNKMVAELNLRKDVAFYIAQITPTRG